MYWCNFLCVLKVELYVLNADLNKYLLALYCIVLYVSENEIVQHW